MFNFVHKLIMFYPAHSEITSDSLNCEMDKNCMKWVLNSKGTQQVATTSAKHSLTPELLKRWEAQ